MTDTKKREIFLVDESMQFRYALILGAAGLVVSIIVSVIFYNYMMAQDRVLLLSGLNQSEEVVEFFIQQQKLLFVKLIAVSVIITLFMFLLGLIFSNRIAGSIFSIRRNLNEIAATGDRSIRFKVRKNDEMQDLVYDMNRVMERVDFDHGEISKQKKER
jgi:signal transduction histidine kinase